MECEDEAHRRGHFELTFPCVGMDNYMNFFSSQRWSNIILCTWFRDKNWSILEPYLARRPPGVDLSARGGDRPDSGTRERKKRSKRPSAQKTERLPRPTSAGPSRGSIWDRPGGGGGRSKGPGGKEWRSRPGGRGGGPVQGGSVGRAGGGGGTRRGLRRQRAPERLPGRGGSFSRSLRAAAGQWAGRRLLCPGRSPPRV